MSKKTNWIASIKNLLQPERGSNRWLQSASKKAITAYRDELWNKLMDPNEDSALRVQIRDHIFPYIDKILRNRDK